MTAIVLRGDAAHLPLPDACVDLIVTSPPYFALRSYADNGEHYQGQIGSEETPREYLEALWRCTQEWARVLKPGGSIFVNLGDKYSQRVATRISSHQDGLFPDRPELRKDWKRDREAGLARMPYQNVIDGSGAYVPEKSLMGLPWRYALGCVDDLGLILRAEIVWDKPNGMPESVTDRVRRSHEQVFHFVKSPRYYSGIDEIREPHQPQSVARTRRRYDAGDLFSVGAPNTLNPEQFCNPLGKLPGSVWEIPSQPLFVPPHLDVDHFAAFPMELPRRAILGWSPSGICLECGEGRRPVADKQMTSSQRAAQPRSALTRYTAATRSASRADAMDVIPRSFDVNIAGYVCTCTPFTDHPERRGKDFHAGTDRERGMNDRNGSERFRRYMDELANPRGPVREYHFNQWTPAPTRSAVVLDPFGGTGTTSLVADVLGRTGITVDRSADYCRLARWRTRDPAERARALGVPKPPPVPEGQASLFDLEDTA